MTVRGGPFCPREAALGAARIKAAYRIVVSQRMTRGQAVTARLAPKGFQFGRGLRS